MAYLGSNAARAVANALYAAGGLLCLLARRRGAAVCVAAAVASAVVVFAWPFAYHFALHGPSASLAVKNGELFMQLFSSLSELLPAALIAYLFTRGSIRDAVGGE